MYQKIALIILAIALLIAGYSPLNNYLINRELTHLTQNILNNWKTNNLTANYIYWKVAEKSPPIYGLDSYKILNITPLKGSNGLVYEISLTLDFPADNLLPSGKTWIIKYQKFPRLGWLVIDFKLIN